MNVIKPDWDVPKNIIAFTTTRQGGVSQAPYDSFNLGDHVGDHQNAVKKNRTLLVEQCHLPQYPLFLTQTHGTRVITLPYDGSNLEADAVYTNHPNQVCLIMTADCLPVLFTNRQGNEVAAAHAGWRGLCNGILEQTVQHFQAPPQEIITWLGPAIGPKSFQVGEDVRQQFIAQDFNFAQAFTPDDKERGKYLTNIYQLAKFKLQKLGISHIMGGKHCTYQETEYFFSFRREKQTGRMASMIWFE